MQALPLFVCVIWEWAFPHSRRGITGATTMGSHAGVAAAGCWWHLPQASQTEKGVGIPSPLGQTVTEII